MNTNTLALVASAAIASAVVGFVPGDLALCIVAACCMLGIIWGRDDA